MNFFSKLSIKKRLVASGMHLAISSVVAALVAILVFFIWYPNYYRDISGGRDLFLLMVCVDVVMGPLVTLTIFDSKKRLNELRRDVGIVVVFQLLALIYGLWTIAVARPIYLVFEIDRFRVVHAIDVPQELLSKAPEKLRGMPYWGPTLLGLRQFKDEKEKIAFTIAALGGVSLSSRPELWQNYDASRMDVLSVAKPISDLEERFPKKINIIEKTMTEINLPSAEVGYVPLVSRKEFGTALVNLKNGNFLGYLNVDSF